MTDTDTKPVEAVGCYDLKGVDLDQRFARFGHEALTDAEVWALSMATMVLPNGSPGCAAYLTRVSGTKEYVDELKVWGAIVACGICSARYKAPSGLRRRAYVEGFDWSWGRLAVADGLTLALYGMAPALHGRCDELKVGEQAFSRIRDFIGGTLVNAIAEFKWALGWALGYHRDRVLEGRWEGVTGLKWGGLESHGTMGRESGDFPLFSSGCGRTAPQKDSDNKTGIDPETLYPAIRTSGCWNQAYADRMARECPVIIYKPRHGKLCRVSDG